MKSKKGLTKYDHIYNRKVLCAKKARAGNHNMHAIHFNSGSTITFKFSCKLNEHFFHVNRK